MDSMGEKRGKKCICSNHCSSGSLFVRNAPQYGSDGYLGVVPAMLYFHHFEGQDLFFFRDQNLERCEKMMFFFASGWGFKKKRKHWVKIHGVRREKNNIWKEMINWWIYFFWGKARWWEFRYGSFSLFLKFVRTFEYQCVDGKMDEDIEDRDVWGWWYGYGWIIHHWIFPKI